MYVNYNEYIDFICTKISEASFVSKFLVTLLPY